MVNALDFGWILLMGGVFALGVWRKVRRVSVGAAQDRGDDPRRRLAELVRSLLGHGRILKERPEGQHHLFVAAAFAGMLLLILVLQVGFRLPGVLAGPLALAVEALGLLGLYGSWRLYRRR